MDEKESLVLAVQKRERMAELQKRSVDAKKKQINDAIAIIRDFCEWSALSSGACFNCPLHGNCMVRIPKYWDTLN